MNLERLLRTCLQIRQPYCVSWLFVVVLLIVSVAAEDFYKLLDVSKGASTKEIRKAFKKKAVTMHPDKNTDDPDAHDKFIKINRAYEVLKDEDLRKKYDQYGEEGLKDDFQKGWGKRYESWKFYQEEFGLYDDDPEIVTLSRSDFDMSVENTEDIWFINFYSPHCSHCHELAPSWREVARELEGVVRVGAVNCADDRQLCMNLGIRSYPTLMMFVSGKHLKYNGDRSTSRLVEYALQFVKVKVKSLTYANFAEAATEDMPWVITFCGDDGDCLLPRTQLKLAAILIDLVNVGSVDCHKNLNLCNRLEHSGGTYFYQPGQVDENTGMEISSLIAQEVAYAVLSQLPDVTDLDSEEFKEVRTNLKSGQQQSWLVHFVEKEGEHDIELRKLPAMLSDFKVGRVICEKMRRECDKFHIHKYPVFLVFKEHGGYEIFYGRTTAHDIAAFARDSADTRLEALGPDDFKTHRVGPQSTDPWFIDFFAPWCPPCMRLLPEFRKAAKNYGDKINFGTVDCTIHSSLCNTYQIHSYPTTVFYNHTTPHQYNGKHNSKSIIEFIQDTMNPLVIALDGNSFDSHVLNRGKDELWLVDFYAPWCGPCRQLEPEWRRVAKKLKDNKFVKVGKVDCQQHSYVCQRQGVRGYPNIRLYPLGGHTGVYNDYNNWFRDAPNILNWATDFFPTRVETLTSRNFREKVLDSPIPWIIDFYAPWCGHCQIFKPVFERVAEVRVSRELCGHIIFVHRKVDK
ncbi:hypothetical protein ScPMuIL_017335 [Solemya velum]